jgi:hypothetical protein
VSRSPKRQIREVIPQKWLRQYFTLVAQSEEPVKTVNSPRTPSAARAPVRRIRGGDVMKQRPSHVGLQL